MFALAAVAGLLVAALVFVALTFDAEDFKSLAIERVQREHQRTLAIPGDVSLRFLPRLGVELGAVSLSERGGGEAFASVQSARVSLAPWPLLRRQLVVDRLQVQGLRATLVRHADGRTNVDDLLGERGAPGAAPAAPGAAAAMRFDVAGVSIGDAAITVDDRRQGRRFVLSKATLETGRLAPGMAGELRFTGHAAGTQPLLDADVELSGRWLPEPGQGRHVLSDIRGAASGRLGALAGVKLQLAGHARVALQPRGVELEGVELVLQLPLAQGRLDLQVQAPRLGLGGRDESGEAGRAGDAGMRSITAAAIVASAVLQRGPGPAALRARFTLPPFTASAPRISLPGIEGELNVEGGAPQAQARVSATLHADLRARTVELAQWMTTATLPGAQGGTVALNAQGQARVALDTEALDVQLAGQLDESRFEGRWGLRGFGAPAHDFELEVDRIDLDRYRAAGAPAAAGPEAGGADAPLDLSALRELNAAGRVRVGTLKAAGIAVQQLRADLRAGAGRLVVAPLAAELYGGRASGSLVLEAGSPPRLATQQAWSGVALGPLLKDALGRETLTGRGTLALDVAAQGATVAALKRALEGSARIELRDGSVRGINVAQVVRGAAALLGRGIDAQTGTGSAAEATDFSELSGSFRIRGGVAHNEDLRAKSPLLRVSGRGDIDLGAGRLDYLVQATVVETLQGQGGPELQSLRGLTVPVRLAGPFDAVGYRVDAAGLLRDLARRKLQDKLEDKARGTLPPAQQQLLERFKGLFGK
jgi:AsmA protein